MTVPYRLPGRALAIAAATVALLLVSAMPAAAAEPTYYASAVWPSAPQRMLRPSAVARDASGNLYVLDAEADRVKKFSAAGALLTSWGSAGSGDSQFDRASAIAVSPSGNVYVADTYNHRVQQFTSAGAFVRAWGALGSENGQFNAPAGIAADDTNVFVSDTVNDRVQRFSTAGTYQTQWRGENTGSSFVLGRPHGISLYAGRVYVADAGNRAVQVFDRDGAFVAYWGPSGPDGLVTSIYNYPVGIVLDGGYAYVSDLLSDRMIRTDEYGLGEAYWGSTGWALGQFDGPNGVAVGGGRVYVADGHNERVQVLDTTGTPLGHLSAESSAGLAAPDGVAGDPAGYVWVADTRNHRLRKYDASGTLLGTYGSQGIGPGQFDSPSGVTVDSYGNVYVADTGNHRVQKLDPDGSPSAGWVCAVTFNYPGDVAVTGDGRVYVADTGNHLVQELDATGAYVRHWGGRGAAAGQFESPEAVSVDATGVVYVADTGNRRVQSFTASGGFLAEWRGPGLGFSWPSGVEVLASGDVAVVDRSRNVFEEYTAAGGLKGTWGSWGDAAGQLHEPSAVGVTSGGDLVVAEAGNHRVQRFARDGADPVTTLGGVPSGWTTAPVVFSLSATDDKAGVAASYFTTGGPTRVYSGPVTIAVDAQYDLRYWSVDFAGHAETTKSATVRVDVTSPLTTSTIDGAWQAGLKLVEIFPSDGCSGLVATYFRRGTDAPAPYTGPFVVSGNGTTTVQYWSTDVAGNVEPTRTAYVRLDNQAPFTSTDATSAWVTGTVAVRLTPTDAHSGLNGTWWRLDGGAVTTGTGPIDVSGPGTHTVEYRSRDLVGNYEATRSAYVRIDGIAPATTSSVDPAWRSAFRFVSLTTSDALSGAQRTWVKIGSGNTWGYDGPFEVREDGAVPVYFWSVDNAGNAEATKTVIVRTDRFAPVSSSDATTTWRRVATVTVAATDTLSGVDRTHWRIDGGVTATYTGPVIVSADGTHEFRFWSVDRVGNVEFDQVAVVAVDAMPPTTTAQFAAGWRRGSSVVTLTAADSRVSVAGTQYRLDGGTVSTYASPFAVTGDGTHTVSYWSTDSLGNREPTRTALVLIDDSPPTSTASADGLWRRGPHPVTIAATDTKSGVAETWYRFAGGPVTRYTGSFNVTDSGEWPLQYWSVDALGNTEATRSAVVRIANEGPLTRSNIGADWRRGDSFTVTFSVEASAGTQDTYYRVDGSPPATYTSGVHVTGQGRILVEYWSVDALGVREATETEHLMLDAAPPRTQAPMLDGETWWGEGGFPFRLEGSDALSGMGHTYYRLDGGAVQTYTGEVLVSDEGRHPVAWWSVDSVGNAEVETTSVILVDSTKPESSSNVTQVWRQPFDLSITATDDLSGVQSIQFWLDDRGRDTFGSSVHLSDGWHTLEYYAVDNAGNDEVRHEEAFGVDGTAPSTTGWVEGGVVTLEATDTASGVLATYWRVNGSAATTYVAPFTVGETDLLEYWSVDNAGNTEAVGFERAHRQVAGADRYTTAVEASKRAFPEGREATAVVIATGRNWPDALGGAALAGAAGGPILLSNTTTFPAAAMAEAVRLRPDKVFILGGTGAVEQGVEDYVRAHLAAATVTRIAGSDRYATARLVAAQVKRERGDAYLGDAVVVTGLNFPDALSGSPVAAAEGWPVYLSRREGLDAATFVEMDRSDTQASGVLQRAWILGGTGAVPAAVETSLTALTAPGNVTRTAGSNRYATAVMAAEHATGEGWLSWNMVGLATGTSFPDALAGGAAQGLERGVLLLTPSASLETTVAAALERHAPSIAEVRYYGGLGALQQSVRDAVLSLLP